MTNVLVSWSGGKDSALALYEIQQARVYRVAALLTTIAREDERIGIHNVRRELIEAQATSINLPLHQVLLTKNATNAEYESAIAEALAPLRDDQGVEQIAFGDLFLEDIKAYREQLLARQGMRGLYPLWGRDPAQLAVDFIRLGFRAIIVSVRAGVLDESFAGKMFDEDFLARLPTDVDPCGERGEFHSFVFDGPVFKQRVNFQRGEIHLHEGHYCCELLPD